MERPYCSCFYAMTKHVECICVQVCIYMHALCIHSLCGRLCVLCVFVCAYCIDSALQQIIALFLQYYSFHHRDTTVCTGYEWISIIIIKGRALPSMYNSKLFYTAPKHYNARQLSTHLIFVGKGAPSVALRLPFLLPAGRRETDAGRSDKHKD